MPTASAAFAINGGASLVKASVSAGGAVSCVLGDLTGVRTVTWSISAVDETTLTTDYVLVTSGTSGSTMTTTALTAGTAAIVKCVVNGGTTTDNDSGDQIVGDLVKTAKVYVSTGNALAPEVGCTGEAYESNASTGATGVQNSAIRAAGGAGVDSKDDVIVATTTTLPANTRTSNTLVANANGAFAAIDGVTLATVGQRFLAKNEATGANNGLWQLSVVGTAGTPWQTIRTPDADTSAKVTTGLCVYVQQGTVNARTSWRLTTTGTITLNTTALVFAEDSTFVTVTASGNITSSAGNIAATAGAVSAGTTVVAGTTMTAGTGLTVTTGNVVVSSGNATVSGTVTATTELKTAQMDTLGAADGSYRRNTVRIALLATTGWTLHSDVAAPMFAAENQATAPALRFRAPSSTAGNAAGGIAKISGGTANGVGVDGGVWLCVDTENIVELEVGEVVVGQRFVALCRGVAVTSTQLPSGTGDGIVYLANATTAATAKPASGIVIEGVSGAVKTWTPNNLQYTVVPHGGTTDTSAVKVRDVGFETVSTTDATVTTIATITMADDSTMELRAAVTGHRTDGGGKGNAAVYGAIVGAKRTATGAATHVGASPTVTSPAFEDAGAAAWAITAPVTGNTVLIRVTGGAGESITWSVHYSYHYIVTP